MVAGSIATPRVCGWMRAFAWLLSFIAVLSLPASWWWLQHERATALRMDEEMRQMRAQDEVAQRVERELSDWARMRVQLDEVYQRVEQADELPEAWTRRAVSIDSQRMSRADAERYLSDLRPDADRVLIAEAIHLRVARRGESLFVEHGGQDQADALLVTIKAELHARGARR